MTGTRHNCVAFLGGGVPVVWQHSKSHTLPNMITTMWVDECRRVLRLFRFATYSQPAAIVDVQVRTGLAAKIMPYWRTGDIAQLPSGLTSYSSTTMRNDWQRCEAFAHHLYVDFPARNQRKLEGNSESVIRCRKTQSETSKWNNLEFRERT